MIAFRFFTTTEQDDLVALAMRDVERRFLRANSDRSRGSLEAIYGELEAWFGGDDQRLDAAVDRVRGR